MFAFIDMEPPPLEDFGDEDPSLPPLNEGDDDNFSYPGSEFDG